MALSNLFGWAQKNGEAAASACGSACGAGDKPEEKPAACGSACGAGDKPMKLPCVAVRRPGLRPRLPAAPTSITVARRAGAIELARPEWKFQERSR